MNFKKIKEIANKKTFKILFTIILVGIFLRTYNFHDWMRFEGDQSRDATVADNVLAGKADWPLLGPHMNHTTFKLGAIYYHFQIISAKIFGHTPESVAFPDLFFSILSIPLLFFLLKRYFSENLSLALTGLYSTSFFAIKYSRFAWNINPIPFFVILFLLALLEFLLNKEKTKLVWIISLGIAIGVGIQMHVILLFLLPATTFIVFLVLMKGRWNSKNIWLKWVLLFSVILISNYSQLASEFKNNFRNSKTLGRLIYYQVFETENTMVTDFQESVVCHIEANTLMLVSFGDQDSCDFSYARLFSEKSGKYLKIIIKNKVETLIIVLGLIFSIYGYGSIYTNFKREKDKTKKYFLGLILLYSGISFLILMMVGDLLRPRYFIHTVFTPLIFIGFLIMFLCKRFSNRKILITFSIILFIFITNLTSIYAETKELVEKRRSEERYIVLGEAESMVDYIEAESSNRKEVYISGSPAYIWEFFNALHYIAQKRGFNLVQTKHRNEFPPNQPVFYITPKIRDGSTINGRSIEDLKIFGKVAIYKLGI
jgi:4-amino-4-deoxy-L-arabinose transferase-like glycosyltransferase